MSSAAVVLVKTPAVSFAPASCCPSQKTRHSVAKALESHAAHMLILVAVIVDVALILAEVLLTHVCPKAEEGATEEDLVRTWEEGLSWSSLALVIALLSHQLLLLLCLGPAKFVEHRARIVDIVTLILALALETALQVDVGLISLVLGWRIFRMIHGVAAGVDEMLEENKSLTEENKTLREKLAKLTQE